MKIVKNHFFLSIVFLSLLFACQKEQINISDPDSYSQRVALLRSDSLSYLEKNRYLDNFFKNYTDSQKDSLYLKMLHYKVFVLGNNLKRYDSAMFYSQKLLKLAIELNDSSVIGDVYFRRGLYHAAKSNIDSAYLYYDKSKEVFIALKDSIKVGRRLLNMAIIEYDYGAYDQSDNTAIQALKYLKDKGKKYQASLYNCMAITSSDLGENNDALVFYNKAMSLTTDSEQIARHKNNIAILYKDLNNYDKSIEILSNLFENLKFEEFSIDMRSRIIANYAYVLWLSGERENIVSEMTRAMKMREENNDFDGQLSSYRHLAEFYENKDKNRSLFFLHKMLTVSKKMSYPASELNALNKLINISSPIDAKKYFNRYVILNDSLKLVQQKAKNKFAKIKYHSEENKKEAERYKIEAAKNELLAHKEKVTRKVIFGLALFVLILLGIFMYARTQRLKKEKVLEVYGAEKRISEKIHDELSNDVFTLMTNYQHQEMESEAVLDELEKIYKTTRNISRENSPVGHGENFEESLRHMLSSYNHQQCRVLVKDLKAVDIKTVDKAKQTVLYYVLRELMVNMKKHSQASLVVLSFARKGKEFTIQYADNGVGLDKNAEKRKNGLQNVDTRIKSIGGSIIFESKSGKGLKARVKFKK